MRPKVQPSIIQNYYTPMARRSRGRCLYPFLYARCRSAARRTFCPFIAVEVGDLTKQTLEEVWTGESTWRCASSCVDDTLPRSAALL
jgi:hypothetical protein